MFDAIGQEVALNIFKKSYENNRLSHAYLLTGPKGVGKGMLAMHMASYLLCKGEIKPCGLCKACIKIKSGNHPDVKIISKGDKSISIEFDVRPLIKEINKKPYEEDIKVVIIKNIENMTIEGQNAILKTLEEPPIDTYIILLTEKMSGILETIKSRCQLLNLQRIPIIKIKEYLLSIGIEENKAVAAASISGGIIGDSLKFLNEDFIALRLKIIEMAIYLTKENADVFKCVNFFTAEDKKIDDILNIMISWYRDIMVLKLAKNKDLIINADFYNELVEESHFMSYNKLDDIIRIIKESIENLKQNSNLQLTMEVMLLNIQEVAR